MKNSLIVLPILMFLSPVIAIAADPVLKKNEPAETRLLWPEGAPGAKGDADKDKPKLLIYPAKENATDVAIVVCPGGGYGGLAMGHEGYEIADWLNKNGISAFICDYRHRGKGYGHPNPLMDAQRAIRIVRAGAKDWNISPNKIGVLGFSAGGHLASSCATHGSLGDLEMKDPINKVSCRPDFAVLCYPVIGFDKPYTHRGSQRNLLGSEPNPELVKFYSNEEQVSKETPPAFLWHTTADKAVPVENSIQFYLACKKNGVSASLHVFNQGRHGLGLGKSTPSVKAWPGLCMNWLHEEGFLPSKSASTKPAK